MADTVVGGASSTQGTTAPRDVGTTPAQMAQMKDGTVSKADQDKAAINVAHPEELLKQLQQLKAHGKVLPGSVTEQIMTRLQDQIRNVR